MNFDDAHKDRLKRFDQTLLSVWILIIATGVLGVSLGWLLCRMYGR